MRPSRAKENADCNFIAATASDVADHLRSRLFPYLTHMVLRHAEICAAPGLWPNDLRVTAHMVTR